jgi:hypothetical protein
MRTKVIIDGFKNSQKFRVILNGVIIYTTVKDMAFNLFGQTDQRVAVWNAMMKLAIMRRVEKIAPIGLACRENGFEVQVDMV